jgi:hypothetical protein
MAKAVAAFILAFIPCLAYGAGSTGISVGGTGQVTVTAGGSGSITTSFVYDSPTGFSITATSQTISTATWNAVTNPSPSSYTLQYSTVSGFATGIPITSDTVNTTAMVSGLTANTQYYARVQANVGGPWSVTAATMTPAAGGGGSFVADDFNRANGNLGGSASSSGASWALGGSAANGNMTITSDATIPAVSGDDNGMLYLSSVTSAANYTASSNLILTDDTKNTLMFVFAADATNWAGCRWNGGTPAWECYENGTLEGAGTTGDTPTTSAALSIVVTGTSYVFKVNGNTKYSGSTGFTTGLVGFYMYYNDAGSGEIWDNVDLTLN